MSAPEPPEARFIAKRRARNTAIGVALGALAVLIWFITIARMPVTS
jgi:hypothetical protein